MTREELLDGLRQGVAVQVPGGRAFLHVDAIEVEPGSPAAQFHLQFRIKGSRPRDGHVIGGKVVSTAKRHARPEGVGVTMDDPVFYCTICGSHGVVAGIGLLRRFAEEQAPLVGHIPEPQPRADVDGGRNKQ